MKVCVCGLPDSGNRLVARLLNAHGVETIIQHSPDKGLGAEYARAVMPVRRPRVWSLAMAANHPDFPVWGIVQRLGSTTAWNARRLLAIGTEWAPEHTLIVELAGIVSDPDRAGETICEHAEVEFEAWPEALVDPDAKYLDPE